MRNLLRDRRGSVAFATVIALVPLIGALAMGAEAGIWYVTRQQAQAAADAAAYSGALKLACDKTGTLCTDKASGVTVASRGEQFAALNSFCNSGATYTGCNTLPAGISQTVSIQQPAANLVKATVSQTQPAYLAAVLGFTTITIAATATAEVEVLSKPCVLSLQDPIVIQGATTVNASNCGLTSNSTAAASLQFIGSGSNLTNAGTFTGGGGCQSNGSGTPCDNAITYAASVTDPLSPLDAAMKLLSTSATYFPDNACGTNTTLTPYDSTKTKGRCYNKMGNGKGQTFAFQSNNVLQSGVYFLSGDVTLSGSTTVTMACTPSSTCGVTWILLPGSTLSIGGSVVFKLTANKTVSSTQVPAALSSSTILALMKNLLIYDPETTASNKPVSLSGNTGSQFNGIIYAPNASIAYTGNTNTGTSTCSEIIAKGVQLSGSSSFDNSGCESTSTSELRIVKMLY